MRNGQIDWKPFALLLVDVQKSFYSKRLVKRYPDFPKNTARLLDLCRREGIEIIHLRASFQPDMSDWMVKYKLHGFIPCIQGTSGIKTMPFAIEKADELIFTKQTFDGFQNPKLLKHLRKKRKRFVLVAGLVTSTCVFLTAASAAQNGFLVSLVDDCCADEPKGHKHTLKHYDFIFSRTTVDNIIDKHDRWLADLQKLDELDAKRARPISG